MIAVAGTAHAGQDDVVLLPTVVLVRETPEAAPMLRAPEPRDPREVVRAARRLDASLRDAVQDLGLTLDVSERPSAGPRDTLDDALIERAKQSWVVSPRIEPEEGKLRIRIVAVSPGSSVLLVRTQEIEPRELELRSMVMLRDVVQAGRRAPEHVAPTAAPSGEPAVAKRARSEGRAVLALNSAALGGYVGLSIQRASGSDDQRLTYPLIALGTGIGLGASMIVADEWDVGLGDAWFISAGMVWPTAAGLLLADGYDVEPTGNRYVYGLVGASIGVAFTTVALTFKGMSEGGATLTHSGGAFGMLLGGIAQLAYEGRTDETPTRGMGYGTGAGMLLAGLIATQVTVAPSRVLLIDLGASLGALTFAAAASPLLFVQEERSAGTNRAWLSTVAAGTLAGGAFAWWLTRPSSPRRAAEAMSSTIAPFGGVLGESRTADGRSRPIYGLGLHGSF